MSEVISAMAFMKNKTPQNNGCRMARITCTKPQRKPSPGRPALTKIQADERVVRRSPEKKNIGIMVVSNGNLVLISEARKRATKKKDGSVTVTGMM
jgi:hypothetical protein